MNSQTLNFRQIFILFLAVIVFLSSVCVGEALASSRDEYKHLTGREKFSEIQENVRNSALSASNYKAKEVYKDIEKALADLQKIHRLVQESDDVDDVIEQVADGLSKIAETYKRVASLKDNINEYWRGEFSYLQDINIETLKTKEQLEKEINKFRLENNSLRRNLESSVDDIESNRLNIGIKANESIINSVDAKILIWNKFYEAQEKLLASLKLNSRRINLLLYALDKNAEVYNKAAEVARLRNSAKAALRNLNNLANIEDLIGDLQDSWLEVNSLVTEISTADFIIDIDVQ